MRSPVVPNAASSTTRNGILAVLLLLGVLSIISPRQNKNCVVVSALSSSSSSPSSPSTRISGGKSPSGSSSVQVPRPATLSPNQEALSKMKPFPRTWVPLASVFELNPDRPTPVQFLGQSYVAFRDNDGKWAVLDDACPHRLAPLSEGRVDRDDSGNLECAYHGWKFDSDGVCQKVPQADAATEAAAKKNPRSCATSYTTVVEKNVLWAWLWPDADPLSGIQDGMLPESAVKEVLPDSSTYSRDLPYGWDTLLENIVDPAHVPFAHHGLQGKRTDAITINMTYPKTIDERGFEFEFEDRTMGLIRNGKGYFRAPYVITYGGEFEPRPNAKPGTPPPLFNLTTILVPTKPGWSRAIIFGSQTRRQDESEKEKAKNKQVRRKKSLVQRIFSILPTWLLHQLSNKFLDSDLAFLHYQEQERQRRGGGANAYFMPAQADRCVAALRKWFETYAKGAEQSGPLPPAISDRNVLFDRLAQHTDQCRHCSKALKDMKVWRKNSYRALALSIVLAKFMAARIVAVGCLVLLRIIASIEPSFKVGGFKHYENQ